MNPSTLQQRPPRVTEAWGRGAMLALLVHAVLIVALTFGVSWRSSEPQGVEADLLAALPQMAAPKVELPPPPAPRPQPQPTPPAPPPKPVETPPPPNEAEIALEKARQEQLQREQAEQQERERLEREKQRREDEQKRQRDEEQKRQREEERRQREEELKRQRAEEQKRQQAEELKRQQAAEREAERKAAEEAKRLEQQRKEQLERMMAQAGTGGTGTAARSSGPSSGYAGRIVAKVKPNIVYPDDTPGNPTAEVEVRAAADGTITGRRLVKSSGVKEWDEAVLRAIDRTDTLPKDVDGRVPSPITILFKLRE
jgi:colicin import membrane protein